MRNYIAAALLCGALMAVYAEPPGDLPADPADLPGGPSDLTGEPAVDLSEEPSAELSGDPPAGKPKAPLLPTGSLADLEGEPPEPPEPPAPVPVPSMPTGFSLEFFGGGTPFFFGDLDWFGWPENENIAGFESLSYAFGAGFTWFPPDYHDTRGFTLMLQFHFPTTLAWTFDGQRYGNHRRNPGDTIEAAEFALGYINRVMVSSTGRFIFPVSVNLRAYYLGLRSDLGPLNVRYYKLNLGFNGTYAAEWHLMPQIYLFGRYTVSIDLFSLTSREATTRTTSMSGKTAYYIDDQAKNGFSFHAAHSFSLGLGLKMNSLSGAKKVQAQDGSAPPSL
jgi:hypothetical protein